MTDFQYPPDDMHIPCRTNADRMFPSAKQSGAREAAKRVCLTGDAGRPCAWLTECRAQSLTHNVEGVWGATDESDRKALRTKLGIVAEPLAFGPSARVKSAPHGSDAGARAHYRRGEKPCGPCLDAARRYANPEQRGQRSAS